jgi:hypothetical protein
MIKYINTLSNNNAMSVSFFKNNKKGSESTNIIIMALFGVVIGVGVAYIFLEAGKAYATGEIFDRFYLARDMALLVDSVYAVPGNIMFTYKEDLGTNQFSIRDNFVTLNPTDENKKAAYNYVEDYQDLEVDFPPFQNIFILKQGQEIFFSDGQETFQNRLSCTPREMDINSIVVEISDELSVSMGSTQIVEEEYLIGVVDLLESALERKNPSFILPRYSASDKKYEEMRRDLENYDFGLSLHFGENEDFYENEIIAYINNDPDSRDFACHILSQLMNRGLDITSTRIKILDGSRLNEDNEKYVLSTRKNMIYFELGNIYSDRETNLFFRQSDVASAIADAVDHLRPRTSLEEENE